MRSKIFFSSFFSFEEALVSYELKALTASICLYFFFSFGFVFVLDSLCLTVAFDSRSALLLGTNHLWSVSIMSI